MSLSVIARRVFSLAPPARAGVPTKQSPHQRRLLTLRVLLRFACKNGKPYRAFLTVFLFLLSACAPASLPIPTATSAPSATFPAPTSTLLSPSPTLSPTATPVPCDPFAAEFCITDGHFVFQRPILPPANDSVEGTYRFASTAGGRRDPHHGVEFVNAAGTPVHAAASGVVVFAGPDKEAVYSPWENFYGNVIVIQHADDLFTLYAHLSAIGVSAGKEVRGGEKIGEVGATGSAFGSHLHFEVRRAEAEDYFSALNPELWLVPRIGEGALAVSIVNARGEFQRADLTIQAGGVSHFIKTYEEKFPTMDENAALGELKPGNYRVTFYFGGAFYERWIEVQSGKLTQTVFVVK